MAVKHKRLAELCGASVVSHDGTIYLELRFDDRTAEDPERIGLSPGEALDLISKLSPAIKTALISRLGGRT